MSDAVSAAFSALADPTRRAILGQLAQGEASVGELAEPFTMSMPAVSKHLRVLEHAGLISRTKSAQWRRCRLRPEGFQAAMSWLRDYETFWTESFDRLAEHLAAEQLVNAEDVQDKPALAEEGDRHGDG